MITLGIYWLSVHYKSSDYDGFIYWGTVIVDVVALLVIGSMS